MRGEIPTKAAVCVSEMARMVGLSRARFYQLQNAGAFPPPLHDENGRPYYNEEQQKVCLEVRRKNMGINGKPVMFNAKRQSNGSFKERPNKSKTAHRYSEIIEGLIGLGLTGVVPSQVEQAIRKLFPKGIEQVEPSQVLRDVFCELRRSDWSDSAER